MVQRNVLFERNPLVASIDVFDDSNDCIWIEYDAVGVSQADHSFTFESTPKHRLKGANQWVTLRFDMKDPRFLGGFNHGDFRIVKKGSPHSQLLLRKVVLTGATTEWKRKPDTTTIPLTFISRTPSSVRPESIRFESAPDTDISIVVPTYDRLAYTLQCLKSLQLYTSGCFEVIVIDNGSSDNSPNTLRDIAGVKSILLSANEGFAKACNYAARSARGKFLVFVNNDTVAQPHWLDALMNCYQRNRDAGAIGSKLVYPVTGEIQHAGVFFNQVGMPCHLGQYEQNNKTLDTEHEVAAITAACLLTPKALFDDMGGFDERFVNGYEDTDYCLRLRESGYKTIYCPNSVLFHYESISEGRIDDDAEHRNRELFQTLWKDKLLSEDSPVSISGNA